MYSIGFTHLAPPLHVWPPVMAGVSGQEQQPRRRRRDEATDAVAALKLEQPATTRAYASGPTAGAAPISRNPGCQARLLDWREHLPAPP